MSPRTSRRGRVLAALVVALAAAAGCSSDEGSQAGPAPAGSRRAPRNPLAFEGRTLEGRPFDFARANARRRLVVYLVDVADRAAALGTRAAQRLHERRHEHNLEVLAVAVPPGYTPLAARRVPHRRPSADELARLARRHLADHAAHLPCIADPDGEIVERYTKGPGRARLDGLPAFYAFPVNARGIAGRPILARFAGRSAEPVAYLARRVLKQLDIEVTTDVDPLAGHFPPAPDVELVEADGTRHRLADYKDRALALVFIATDCARCKQELALLGELLARHGRPARGQAPWLEVVAVCVDAEGEALARLAEERGYAFPVAGDPEWRLRSAFRYRGATPDTFLVAPDGRIHFRHRGYTADLEPVLRMEVAALVGEPSPPLLDRSRYAGDRACRICHPAEHADWALSRHACAWETLVRLGREDEAACARCHVTGGGQPGGFVSDHKTPHLADVQCESCHGRAGCSAFLDRPVEPVAPEACTRCHDAEHSPRFSFAAYRPRIVHDRPAALSREERRRRRDRLCEPAGDPLFESDTPYVGSAACAPCHPTEHAALADGPHAAALRSLAEPGPERWDVPRHKRGVVGLRKPGCFRCHVTGFGRPGGFPRTPPPEPLAHPRAGVGCEACHGPGKAHADDPHKPRTVARLGGTCPECNVLPICRRCHDDANDPDFDYRQALPRARHPVGQAVEP
ncbi:MAG: multiheme c-type cytochrome [Candidatus Brocadiia bacterium]